MPIEKRLDDNGLLYFWQYIKTLFAKVTDLPTKLTDLINDGNFVTDASYTHTDNNYTTTEKNKLGGIASGAEVNQNAFSTVKVGGTNVAADAKTDTLEIVAGSNITLAGDATNDQITISATDTTYDAATTSTAGLMSAADKTKLNGVATGAEVNQNAFGNVKIGSSTIAADSKTDTLELAGGTNITLAADTAGDKVTISTSAQANVIETVKVNGTALTPSGKAVDVTVPTKVSDITNDSGFQTAQQVTSAINSALSGITGISFEVVQNLPATGTAGRIYLVANSGSGTNSYDEYIYYNSSWERLGTTDVDLTNYFNTTNLPALTNAEIDAILAS